MLLANLSKSHALERLVALERPKVVDLSPSTRAITQLIELFNRGTNEGWNNNATYNYLAYVFADLAKVRCTLAQVNSPLHLSANAVSF